MSNVYLRQYPTKKEKRFYCVVRRQGHKDVHVNLGAISKREAEKRRTRLYNQVLDGSFGRDDKTQTLTIDEFCKEFIDYAKGIRSAYTICIYRNDLNKFLDRFSGYNLDEIHKGHIEKFLSTLTFTKGTIEYKSSGRTKNILLSVLNVMFDKAVEWEHLQQSPSRGIKRFRENSMGKRPLSDSEIKTALANASPNQEAILKVALLSGLRLNALRNLKFSDINWDAHQLKAIKKGVGHYFVSMNPELEDTLRHLYNHWPNPWYRKHNPRYLSRTEDQREFVFCNQDGSQLKKGLRCLDTLYKKLNIENVAIHGLRKTFCTLLAKNNVHPKVASELMGHTTPRLTMEIYTSVDNYQKQHAVNSLPSLN